MNSSNKVQSRRNTSWLVISATGLFLIFFFFACYAKVRKESKDQVLIEVLLRGIGQEHFRPADINDDFSNHVFDVFLKRLDYNKRLFLQSDLKNLKPYRSLIDDELKAGSMEFFDSCLVIYNTRILENQKTCEEILSGTFDFTKDESIELDSKKYSNPATEADMKEAWRLTLKYQVLAKYSELLDQQEKAITEKDTSVKIKTMPELQADAQKKIEKNTEDWFKRLSKQTRNERLSSFLNSVVNVFDPHSEFFAPREKANYDIMMSGQLEGIGSQLQEKDGFIKITSIVPGSPSARSGILKAGDIILKVGQGDKEPVDVVDMKLDDAVQLIRGKKGTEVRLTIKKVDNSILVVPLIRDVIVLEETYAQSWILQQSSNKYGYIRLPLFYADFTKSGSRSCAEDVKKEIEKLNKENVKGIVLDLRDNGGGSLRDVVEMAGLFIKKGPIVQVKSRGGSPYILEDTDADVQFSGPLVVMVNSASASASEIMAAAMQDYKRGIIVGTPTYGKGTVQRIFNMDDYVNGASDSLKPLGSVKITVQKFYRINGGATQLKGVTPDIILKDQYSYIDLGEKESDYPMAWDEIPSVKYETWSTPAINYQKIKDAEASRVKKNDTFKMLDDKAKELKHEQDNTLVNLKLDKFRVEQKKNKENLKKFELPDQPIQGMNVINAAADTAYIHADTTRITRNKDWLKVLSKDPYIFEVTNILGDMQ